MSALRTLFSREYEAAIEAAKRRSGPTRVSDPLPLARRRARPARSHRGSERAGEGDARRASLLRHVVHERMPWMRPEDHGHYARRPAQGRVARDEPTRRLAAILAADVAGYSRLMGADEEGTLERLKALRRELLDPKIAEHTAASSRPPATACWWNLPASSMRCAARSRCSRRCPSGTPASRRTAASNCASASISAT